MSNAKSVTLAELREANVKRNKEWDPNAVIDIPFRCMEATGEFGEAMNVAKKLERERRGLRGSRDTREHMAEEIADVLISMDLIAMDMGIDLDEAVRQKFNATSDKNGLTVKL